MTTLDVSKNGYGIEVLSWYIWGQKTPPNPSEMASNKWIDRKENIVLNISAAQYIKYVDGYTSAANFGIFQKFFERLVPVTAPNGETILLNDKYTKAQMESVGAKINSDGYYELNIKQMGDIIYGKDKNPFYNESKYEYIEKDADISHYTLDVNSENYAERAFVFGSTKMTFTSSDVRFLINATTFEPEFIDNLQIKPKNDNFDFEGGGTTAKVANHYLNKITDPSGIGRTVHFNFTDKDSIEHIKISRGEFSKLRTNFRNSEKFEPIDMAKAYERYFSDTIIPSGVIDYLDENNKLVMFDGSGDNSMYGTQADNLDFNENLLSGIIGINNHYKQHIKNGITYIGGKGSDTITGTEFDDILYSNDKSLKDDNSSDTLQGGKGYDIYYAGDKDIIKDSDHKGEVYFNNIQLIGGMLDKDKSSNSTKVYLSEDKNIEYHLNSDTLKVKNIKERTELTINNFNKEEKSLNINLSDNLGKEVAIVIDTTGSMWDDIETTKSRALAIAKNIFRENSSKDLAQSNTFSKISIVTFSDNNIKTIGTYYNYNSFQSGINSVNIENGGTEYHCAAMIEGMSNFTKDNGLDKHIFLMTDEPGDDNHRMDEVIAKANNFGKEMVYLSKSSDSSNKYDNSVKINVISINSNLSHLKRLSDETGGVYFQPNSLSELEDALFDASNLGTNKDETITGNDKNNIIEGKGGDDILKGGLGSDTYIFKPNFDKDTIIETNPNNIDKNIIDLTKFSIKDTKFEVKDNSLVISIIDTKADTFMTAIDKITNSISNILNLNFSVEKINTKDIINNQITIKEFFNKDNELKISTIKFSDYIVDETILKALSKDKKDNIEILSDNKKHKFNKSSLIISNEDIIETGYKDDILVANKNNQILKSNNGKDTLITNKDNTTLIGKNGNDTYIVGKDANNTIIKDKEYVNLIDGGNDTLILNDIDKRSVEFKLGGSFNKDLIINYKTNSSDDTLKTLTIENQTNKFSSIENISLNDTFLDKTTIDKIIQDLNSYSGDKGIRLDNFTTNSIDKELMQIYANGWS